MNEEFTRIFNLYYNDIFRLIYSYTLNTNETKDILQDTFLKYYKNIEKISKDDKQIKKWLFKVAANQSKDFLKSSWRWNLTIKDDHSINNDSSEMHKVILNVLSKIQVKYRLPIYLFYYEGFEINEIADILKLKPSTVKMRLSNAKKKIKKEMER